MIQQHIGDPAVRLVHSNDVTAGWELSSLGCRFWLLLVVCRFLIGGSGGVSVSGGRSFLLLYRDRERRGSARYLTTLKLHRPEQFSLAAGPRIVTGKHISSRTFRLWFQDRSLALQIEVVKEELAVGVEV
jgi:hypothetical protein